MSESVKKEKGRQLLCKKGKRLIKSKKWSLDHLKACVPKNLHKSISV